MLQQISVDIHSPTPPSNPLRISLSPVRLMNQGFVTPVILQTPSITSSPPTSKPIKSMMVMALLDTGASRTSISDKLAKDLELEQIGFSQTHTAAGVATFPDYIVDIQFPNNVLRNFKNWSIGSCKLPYEQISDQKLISNPSYFGLLIGRDMMAQWNIVWNGSTSSVFISD